MFTDPKHSESAQEVDELMSSAESDSAELSFTSWGLLDRNEWYHLIKEGLTLNSTSFMRRMSG